MGPMGRRHRLAIDGGPTIGRTTPRRVWQTTVMRVMITLYHYTTSAQIDATLKRQHGRKDGYSFCLGSRRYGSAETEASFLFARFKIWWLKSKSSSCGWLPFRPKSQFRPSGVSYDGMSLLSASASANDADNAHNSHECVGGTFAKPDRRSAIDN